MTKVHPPFLLFSKGRHKKLFSLKVTCSLCTGCQKINQNKSGQSPKKQTNNTEIHTQYLKYPENQPLFKMIIPQIFLLKMNQNFFIYQNVRYNLFRIRRNFVPSLFYVYSIAFSKGALLLGHPVYNFCCLIFIGTCLTRIR